MITGNYATISLAAAYDALGYIISEMKISGFDTSIFKTTQVKIYNILYAAERNHPDWDTILSENKDDAATQQDRLEAEAQKVRLRFVSSTYKKTQELRDFLEQIDIKPSSWQSKLNYLLIHLKACADETIHFIENTLGYRVTANPPTEEKTAPAQEQSAPKEKTDLAAEEKDSIARANNFNAACNKYFEEHDWNMHLFANLLGGTCFRDSESLDPLKGGDYDHQGKFKPWPLWWTCCFLY